MAGHRSSLFPFFYRLGLLLASSVRASSSDLVYILTISPAPSSCFPLSRSCVPHVFFLPIVSSEGCLFCGCSRKSMGALSVICYQSIMTTPTSCPASSCCSVASSTPAPVLSVCCSCSFCWSVATPVEWLKSLRAALLSPSSSLRCDLLGYCVVPRPSFLPRLYSAVVYHSLQCQLMLFGAHWASRFPFLAASSTRDTCTPFHHSRSTS